MFNEIVRKFGEGLKSGSIKPLKRHVFKKTEIEKAFRFMSTGKHIGKVVIQMKQDDKVNNFDMLEKVRVSAVQQTFFDPAKSVAFIGGLGGIGLGLSRWVASKGAKNIVLSSRSGVKSDYQQLTINLLRERTM